MTILHTFVVGHKLFREELVNAKTPSLPREEFVARFGRDTSEFAPSQ